MADVECDILAALDAALADDDDAAVAAACARMDAHDAAERDRLAAPHVLGAAAAWYAARGLAVFPCKPGGKTPLTRHGFHEATSDPDQVRRWWQRWPQANIGAPTGNSFDVIDVDAPAGWWSLAKDEQLWASIRRHSVGRSITPSGGAHYWMPAAGLNTGSHVMADLPGVDSRGAGGYVIVPPSTSSGNRRYAWADLPQALR